MRKKKGKETGLIRGTSRAVFLSVMIHGVVFLGAGLFVVYKVVVKEPVKFVPPPPIERKQMKLKKPRVKVRQAAKPRATRITTKSVQSMPDIQLPEISGVGTGLSGGLDGFELVPQASEVTMFGGSESTAVGNDFEGTFYVLNRSRSGEDLGYDYVAQQDKVNQFIASGWSPYVFAPYYRSPKKLYATQFIVPLTPSAYGPQAFGINFDSKDNFPEWVAHYKGKIRSKKGGKYRFWGAADEVLLVRVNEELVLNGSWWNRQKDIYDWGPTAEEHLQYVLMANKGYVSVGHWFTLEPGEVVEMEVLIGDFSNPHFGVYLMIEDEEETPYYSHRSLDDMPVLPAFRTAEMSEAIKDQIKYDTFRGEVDLDGGEIFNVY